MEALLFTILQIQCTAILFSIWKMRQWQKQDNDKIKFLDDVQKVQIAVNTTILEYIKDLRSIGDNQTLLNSDIYKQLVEQNKRIHGLSERLKNTEQRLNQLENGNKTDRTNP